jgi:MYXO-CTERM domain-containing protein
MGAGASLSVIGGTLNVTAAAPTVNFTGTTGTLTVNGTVGSVALSGNGTLGGAGTVGTVTTSSGSILSPGNSPGTLNVNGDLTLAAGMIIQWQVQDALDLSAGFDKFHVNKVGGLLGNLDLTADYTGNRVKIEVISLLGTDDDKGGNGTLLGAPDNFDNADTVGMAPRFFDFMRIEGTVNKNGNDITDIFEFDLDQFQYSNGGANNAGLWSISEWNDGTYTYLRITAVPEPSTYGFGLGALALAAAAIRRRRKLKAKPAA